MKKHQGHINFESLNNATDTIENLLKEGYEIRISPVYSEDLDCEGYSMYFILNKDRRLEDE